MVSRRRSWTVLHLAAAGLLLLLLLAPGLSPLPSIVESAEAVVVQEDPGVCEAWGPNWTACTEALTSDDTYAEANDGSPLPPLTANYTDGSAVAVGTSATLLGSAFVASPGDNVIVASVQLDSVHNTQRGTVPAGDLRVTRNGSLLASNEFPLAVESNGADARSSQSWSVVVRDSAAPGNASYNVTARATATPRVQAELKLLVIQDPPSSSWADGGPVNVTANGTVLLSHASGLRAGRNVVVAAIQLRSTAGQQAFNASAVRLERGGAPLANNTFQKIVSAGAVSESASLVLLAVDEGAPANATYNVTARASVGGARGEAKLLVLQGLDAALLHGNATAVNTSQTLLGELTTSLWAGANAVLAVQDVNGTTASAVQAAAGDERLNHNGSAQSVNQFRLLTSNSTTADGKDHLLLWHHPNASADAVYNVTVQADALGMDARTQLLAFTLRPPDPPGKNDTVWRDFGFSLDPEDVVERVEVGVEWYRTTTEPILNLTVSWDGGTSWASNLTAANKSADDDTVEWLDFTGATAWLPAHLSDGNFRVRVGTNGSDARLDYLTVRLTVNVSPAIADLDIEDGGGQSVAGEVLQVATPYAFLFNVTDPDGWADIAADGGVDLRLWYDGGGSPELAFGQQTNGSSYRIVLRYQDTGDPGNASLTEWSVVEGQAVYDAGSSSQASLFDGPTLVGYAFRLVLTLGPPVKRATDPVNAGPGAYDDVDSWNAEVRVNDGLHTVTEAATPTSAYLEFGVGPNAVLSYDETTDDATVQVGETTDLRVTLTNVGPGEAGRVWANLTLPSELAYVSDDAANVGGVLTGTYDFRFDDVGPGDYVFNVTVEGAGGTANGTVVSADFAYEAHDPLGDPLDADTGSVTITVTNAILTYDASATEANVDVGGTTDFRFTLENNGEGAAGTVWVNVTLAPELAYVSDDAGTIGGVLTGTYDFRFDDLAPGSHVFNVTVAGAAGVPDGTVATTDVSFQAVDPGGTSLGSDNQTLNVTVVNAVLAAVPGGPYAGDPGDEVVLSFVLRNDGDVEALNLRADVVLDGNSEYVASNPAASYDPGTRTLRWTLASLGPGEQRTLEWTVVLATGLPDGGVLLFPLDVRGEDPAGAALPRGEDEVRVTVTAPVFAPALVLDRTEAEKGDVVQALLYFNNTGAGTALYGWANWSLGGHYALRSVVPAPSLELTADGFGVTLTNVTAGDHVLTVRLEVLKGMNTAEDGDSMGMTVEWSATDANGNPVHASSHPGAVSLLAPAPSLSLTASPGEADPDDVVRLDVTVLNDGGAPALGWLNLSLPEGALYVGDNGTYPVSATPGRVSWTLPAIPADGRLVMQVEVQVTGSASVVPFRFSYNYTDGRGSTPQQRLSNAESVQVTSPLPGGLDPWLLVLLLVVGAVVLGLVLWFLWRRRGEPQIEEVFVGHRDGVLLSHQSRTLTPDKDNDILVAMFKTVTDFVQDAFSSREDVPMRSIRFGESNILVEHGTHHFVAVVYRGEENEELEARLAALSARIEEEFGDILAQFSGDMRETRGIRKLLPAVWGEGLEGEGPFSVVSEAESSWLQRLRDLFRRGSQP